MFPEGLREICREAKVSFPADRARFAEAMKAKGCSAKERSIERGGFDFEYRRFELEARVKELDYTFKLRTEDVKDEPYWRARREQFSSLCNWMLKRLRKAEISADLEAVAEDFRKLKMHYVRTVWLSDSFREDRAAKKNSDAASKATFTA